jgi:hypothetical protein
LARGVSIENKIKLIISTMQLTDMVVVASLRGGRNQADLQKKSGQTREGRVGRIGRMSE